MIAGIFHQGSGLGNQLHRYVATRVLAADKGYDWGMLYHPDGSGKEHGFKGRDFIHIDPARFIGQTATHHFSIAPPFGLPKRFPERPRTEWNIYTEKEVRDEFGNDIRGYDPEINFVEDNTVIDGEFQDERYFGHRMQDVNEWLGVEPLDLPDDLCVIGFRGGEFVAFPDLLLTKDYWDEAIAMMPSGTRFEVHTDDPVTAKQFFPEYPVIHDVGLNWRSIRYSRYAIVANSSFYILPRLLKHRIELDESMVTIAPRYWARRNTKTWCLPQNYYKDFRYI